VAEHLAVKIDVVLSWIHRGELRAFNASEAGGRPRWRIDPEDLQLFIARRTPAVTVPRQRRRRHGGDAGVIEFYREGPGGKPIRVSNPI
jgi:hypothetical protein